MTTNQKIEKILEESGSILIYRPEISKYFKNNVIAAIMFSQVFYLYKKFGCKPFFKYKTRCESQETSGYKSWEEDLGVGRRKIDKALSLISESCRKREKIDLLLEKNAIVRHTDISNKTFYYLNENIYLQTLEKIYPKTKSIKISKAKVKRINKDTSAETYPESLASIANNFIYDSKNKRATNEELLSFYKGCWYHLFKIFSGKDYDNNLGTFRMSGKQYSGLKRLINKIIAHILEKRSTTDSAEVVKTLEQYLKNWINSKDYQDHRFEPSYLSKYFENYLSSLNIK